MTSLFPNEWKDIDEFLVLNNLLLPIQQSTSDNLCSPFQLYEALEQFKATVHLFQQTSGKMNWQSSIGRSIFSRAGYLSWVNMQSLAIHMRIYINIMREMVANNKCGTTIDRKWLSLDENSDKVIVVLHPMLDDYKSDSRNNYRNFQFPFAEFKITVAEFTRYYSLFEKKTYQHMYPNLLSKDEIEYIHQLHIRRTNVDGDIVACLPMITYTGNMNRFMIIDNPIKVSDWKLSPLHIEKGVVSV